MSEDAKLVDMLRGELRSGFGMLADEIRQTNARLDQTNARLDQTNARLDQTNARLDQTNANLTEFKQEISSDLAEFKQEVSGKLDGISSFLMRSEEHTGKLASRLDKVERRVEKLEKRDKSA